MSDQRIHITDVRTPISHELRTDSGRYIEWIASDGTVRRPREKSKTFFCPGLFTAAGKVYPNLKALAVSRDETGHLCKDIYGREVFCVAELFPCFDSYDYANETRYYRWYYIKQNNTLTRIYHADGRNLIEVTEDVASMENKCADIMKQQGWI